MQAIILAAGMGKRLRELTRDNTKCMVRVNGQMLIDRTLRQLEKRALSRIIIVVGYKKESLIAHIDSLDLATPVVYVENTDYEQTNNIYSLYLAKDLLCEDDTLLFESDIIFEDSVLDELVDDPRETLVLVDRFASWMDGTCVRVSEDDTIDSFVTSNNFNYGEVENYYKTVNIYKFSRKFSQTQYVPFLEAYQKSLGMNEYYEQVLRVVATLDNTEIRAKKLSGQKWYEIDDAQDLNIAESIFAESKRKKVDLMNIRYGGYWRYPDLKDFCYLVNPYFPPKKMKDEMRSNFDTLLTQYPSGLQVNSLLAAKNFDVPGDYITVGNGAAELIKSIMGYLEGNIGLVRPTFEEYPNRYDKHNIISFYPDNPDYSYGADDLMTFFDNKNGEIGINTLILVNPDNPSGNYIQKADVLRLIRWTRQKNISFVLDESFVDFADEEENSMITEDILRANPKLYVIKSISKSYGIPGARLGVIASSDISAIKYIKKDVAIWNINSFGEFYMQIVDKYRKSYDRALDKIRAERTRLIDELNKFPKGIRVIPSQANFIMVEITDGFTGRGLQEDLLEKYQILVKDLSWKLAGGEYLRISVRDTKDNDYLINALRQLLV